MKRLTRLFHNAACAIVIAAATLAPAVAWAQTAVPQPRISRSPPIWLGYLVMVVLVTLVMVVSLMPAKRGHQD